MVSSSYEKYSWGNMKDITFYEMDFQRSNFYELQRGIAVKWITTMMKCVGVNEK